MPLGAESPNLKQGFTGSRRYRYEWQQKSCCNQSGTASDRLCQEAVFFCIQKGRRKLCLHPCAMISGLSNNGIRQ